MKDALRLNIVILFFIQFFSIDNAIAQGVNPNPYDIINALSNEINSKFPVLDSLYPSKKIDVKGEILDTFFTRKEKKEIREASTRATGFRLSNSILTNKKLIPAEPIFKAFINPDSANLKLIEEAKPFYMLSNPIFFHHQTKAIISLSLIKGFGSTFILEKREGKWIVIKQIYEWM